MSHHFELHNPRDEAGAIFVGEVGEQLQAALIRLKDAGVTQQELAERLGVDRSRVNRCFSGTANLTLKAVGELAWAMGAQPIIQIVYDDETDIGRNWHQRDFGQRPGGSIETTTNSVAPVLVRTNSG